MSFQLLGAFVIFFNIVVSNQFRYDYFYNEAVGGWLKLHVMPSTFQEAFLTCKAEGTTLASPLNEIMRDVMAQVIRESKTESCGIYTGVHATIFKVAFTSIEGIPLSRLPSVWAPSEPDNYKNKEDCIVMLHNGTLVDTQCADTFPYVCYKKTETIFINECGTIDSNYKLNQQTGSCYKFHYDAHTWPRAYKICMAEGGHLAIINNDVEARFLKEMFDNIPSSSIQASKTLSASIGFKDWDKQALWLTVQGETLQEAGYAKWVPGEPVKGGEACGGILRDVKGEGILNDVPCNVSLAFICEMVPNSLNAPS